LLILYQVSQPPRRAIANSAMPCNLYPNRLELLFQCRLKLFAFASLNNKNTTNNVPIIPTASPIAKYSTKPNSAILKTTRKLVLSCMMNSYFPTVIANWLTAAFRYKATTPKPISDICSIECVLCPKPTFARD
jgi:hypothetical protein